MTAPTEPGWYWAKRAGAFQKFGWMPLQVVRLDKGLHAADGRRADDQEIKWGPRIPPPDEVDKRGQDGK